MGTQRLNPPTFFMPPPYLLTTTAATSAPLPFTVPASATLQPELPTRATLQPAILPSSTLQPILPTCKPPTCAILTLRKKTLQVRSYQINHEVGNKPLHLGAIGGLGMSPLGSGLLHKGPQLSPSGCWHRNPILGPDSYTKDFSFPPLGAGIGIPPWARAPTQRTSAFPLWVLATESHLGPGISPPGLNS